MKTKKYDIYSYWSDKAITKSGEVKRIGECTDGEEAVKVTELPDEIFCWACQCPPYRTADTEDSKVLWNKDTLLDRAHILPRSKGGDDSPANLFLLCPNCHAEAPDTTNPRNFFSWIYYRRRHEVYSQLSEQEVRRAAEIRGIDLERLFSAASGMDPDQMRAQLIERCGLYGGAISRSSKAMAILDILEDYVARQRL